MERMHPEDLRALIAGMCFASPKWDSVRGAIACADDLLAELARTVKPVVPTLMACPLCGAATPSEALQPVQHTETCPLGAPYRAAKPTPEPVSSFKELHAKAKADGAKDERERLASLFSLVGREDVAKVIKESKL